VRRTARRCDSVGGGDVRTCVTDATRSTRLGRRGFTPAIDHPVDRAARRWRVGSSAAIATCVLVTISFVELVWIIVR
jgi:hypothetical protein